MLRTSLGRIVLCAASRTASQSSRRLLLPSELLRPTAATQFHRTWVDQLRFQSSSAAAALATSSSASPETETENAEPNPNPNAKDDSLLFTTLSSSIHPGTLKALTKSPFKHTHMSPVQAEILPLLPTLALPHNLHPTDSDTPRDLLVKAKTGTGKTLAFLVPAIESRLRAIKAHVSSSPSFETLNQAELQRAETVFARSTVGALVISPTRELAMQIAVEASNLTTHHRGWGVQVLLGGESKIKQMRSWDKGRKDIVVATPGRILDLLNTEPSVREAIAKCELLVLDEADTLLDMGFRDDITRLLTYLPPQPIRQTFLFSATVSPAIQQIARASLSPTHRFVNCVSPTDSDTHAHIPQHVHVLRDGKEMIHRLLNLIAADMLTHTGKDGKAKSRIIVFLSTTNAVSLFTQFLRKALLSPSPPRGSSSSSMNNDTNDRLQHKHILPLPPSQISLFEIHSKRDQSARTRTSASFRASTSPCSILITSDVSARGVDYPGITRVIQLGLPSSRETYVHRVGRTGRAGRTEGRGDLVVMDWEGGFVRRKLKDVGVKEVGAEEAERELAELGDVVGPPVKWPVPVRMERAGGKRRGQKEEVESAPSSEASSTAEPEMQTRFGRAAREEMRHSASSIVSTFSASSSPSSPTTTTSSSSFRLPTSPYQQRTETQELIHSTFASLAGFLAGRAGDQGIDARNALSGLRRSWMEMWDLDREPVLPRGLQSGGDGGNGNWGRGRGGGGGGGWRDSGREYGRDRRGLGTPRGWGESSGSGSGSGSGFLRNNRGRDSIEGHFSSDASNGNGYGYDKGSRQGSQFSRAGQYEHKRGTYVTHGSNSATRAKRAERESSWERGGESRWRGGRGDFD